LLDGASGAGADAFAAAAVAVAAGFPGLTDVAALQLAVAADPVWVAVALHPAAAVLAFVWGALWGSFGNVVIYRLPRGESVVYPPSHCPACSTPIRGFDNVPIFAYLWLRGRCRHCKTPYSARYAIVEALAATMALALWLQLVRVPVLQGADVPWIPWLLWFAFAWSLLIVTYIDLDVWIIPDTIVLPMGAIGVAAALWEPRWLGIPATEALGAGAAGYVAFWAIRWLYLKTRGIEALGLGDAKLLWMVGAFTGYAGLAWTVAAGALQGLLVAVPTLLLGGRVANSELHDVHGDDPELGEEDPDAGVMGARVPFGPFLALAALEFVFLRRLIEAGFAALLGG
jgi:leader peptidase (prepilin peptidase)/N-methyltransferase